MWVALVVLLGVALGGCRDGTRAGRPSAARDTVVSRPPADREAPASRPSSEGELAAEWWRAGDAACPAGAHLEGAAPPAGSQVFCALADGRKHGPSTVWHSEVAVKGSGDVSVRHLPARSAEDTFAFGELDGASTRWYRDGTVAWRGRYVRGLEDGVSEGWDEAGRLAIRRTHDRGRLVKTEVFRGGAPVPVGVAEEGWWTEGQAACPEGTRLVGAAPPVGLAVACELPSGRRHGPAVAFYESGEKKTEGTLVDGRREGTWTHYDRSGQVLRTDSYVDGRRVGARER